MPDLPALTLAQEHYDRIVAAIPGSNGQEKLENYKIWLTNRLIDLVEVAETRKAVAAVQNSLPQRQTEPVRY